MERELLRTGLSGSALPAWLVRHDLVERTAPPPLLDGLAQWLGWTEAIALSASLNTAPPPRPARPAPMSWRRSSTACIRPCAGPSTATKPRLRLPDVAGSPSRWRPTRASHRTASATPALQQAMESAIAALRAQARAAVARQSPRLAAVDAVMESMMAAREQLLLARLPTLLETHFERLRRAHDDRAWIPRFHADLQQLATAELQLRLQPVQGLMRHR